MVEKDWLFAAKAMLVADYHVEGCLLLVSDDAAHSKFPELPVIGA